MSLLKGEKYDYKKITTFLTIVIFALLISVVVSASFTAYQETKSENAILLEIEAQKQAVAADSTLMNYYFKEGEGIVYPDYFAGRYIENGIYYLCLNNPPEGIEEIYDILFGENKEAVVYLYKDYSYNDLQNKAREIGNSLTDLEYYSCGVNDKTGQIEIEVPQKDVARIQNSFSSKNSNTSKYDITVKQGNPIILESRTAECGEIVHNSNWTPFSLGIYGTYQNQPAFITAGHVASEGETIYAQGYRLGKIELCRYSNCSLGDFAIGFFDDTYFSNISHTIYDSAAGSVVLDGGTVDSPCVGTIVQKYGSYGKYSTSTVISVNEEFTVNNIKVTGLTQTLLTNGSSQQGDSGGPYMVGDAFCGIHHGRYNHPEGDIYLYFTPYIIIRNAGFTAISRHEGNYWSYLNDQVHSGYCTICEENATDFHSLNFNGTVGTCTRCGGTVSVASVPEIEASIW